MSVVNTLSAPERNEASREVMTLARAAAAGDLEALRLSLDQPGADVNGVVPTFATLPPSPTMPSTNVPKRRVKLSQ